MPRGEVTGECQGTLRSQRVGGAMMTIQCSGRLVLAWSLTLLPAVGWAQTLGGIAGLVKDARGGVLPGATVEGGRHALIEKVRTGITDGQGQYKIVELPAGVYTMTFTVVGFNTVKHEGLEVN